MRAQLYAQLQRLDHRFVEMRQHLATLEAELQEGQAVRELYERRRDVSGRLKHERGHATDLQWELDEVETRLRELMAQEHEGPSDPLVARELAVLREQRNQLEDQALAQMERVEHLVGELTDADRIWHERSAQWATREPLARRELEEVMESLEALQNEREAVQSRLAPDALAVYDDLQRRHRGSAITVVRNRACGACRARLSAAVFDLLAGPDPLVRCPRCTRVLAPLTPGEALASQEGSGDTEQNDASP
jgi:predicted  nucleic acid-binding Zn-ribbon protein